MRPHAGLLGVAARQLGVAVFTNRALFLTTLRLNFGFAEVVDIRHSLEPQDLSDCRAPLVIVPVSGGEENGLPLGVPYINRVTVGCVCSACQNYVFPPNRFSSNSRIDQETFSNSAIRKRSARKGAARSRSLPPCADQLHGLHRACKVPGPQADGPQRKAVQLQRSLGVAWASCCAGYQARSRRPTLVFLVFP